MKSAKKPKKIHEKINFFLHERKNERVDIMNVNEFFFEKFERERERVHILRDELERELERQKSENFQYSDYFQSCM